MNTQKTWRILVTKPTAQLKTCEQLTKLKIEHYCPTSKAHNTSLNKIKLFEQTMFDRKVFVKVDEIQQSTVLSIDGVQSLVYWLQQPAVVADAEVDALRNFIANHDNIVVEKMNISISQKPATFFISSKDDNAAGHHKRQEYCKATLPSLGVALVAPSVRKTAEVLKLVSSRYSIPKNLHGFIQISAGD